ncbi:hypothetical protein OF829_03445 [Sphingomonas sp. LB-2]|uniref:hypothetical protein n=1 Tax=Sphingomonas caeni TaxID=2984949 RepID=UPI0022322628|nr:hypothetical protein [Sphingomonas caeni]MCW3846280.1 hypothetical protein [Sphingomonas caeni]
MYHAYMIGLALFLALAPVQHGPSACEIAAEPGLLVSRIGERVSVTGRYDWDIHYQQIHPDGCAEETLFVSLTSKASDRVSAFLASAYPGKMFGGGSIWGSFSGTVKKTRGGFPYLLIDTIAFDPARRMTFADPS